MSLIVSIRTGEGIVMASDSRMTTTIVRPMGATKNYVGAHFSDTTYKTFMLGNRIGVSTCGDAFVKGRAVAGWMQVFAASHFDSECSVLTCAQRLASFFGGIQPESEIIFHVCGYQETEGTPQPVSYRLSIRTGGGVDLPPADTGYGARWDGQQEILTRILKSCYVISESRTFRLGDVTTAITKKDGTVAEIVHKNVLGMPSNTLHFPDTNINFAMFTLQDAVDFASYAIRTTIETIRFKSEPLTVAEPIDVLVITPDKAKWLQHKELHV